MKILKPLISYVGSGARPIITGLCLLNALPPASASESNVVLIVVDDLGWTDLGIYGSDFHQTPRIDRLAREGMRFLDAYAACTVCSPSRAAIMTGKYPARLHLTDWIPGHRRPFAKLDVPDWTMRLAPEAWTLAEAFQKAGYLTAHLGKWHLGEDECDWPEHHGFDVNIGGWKLGAPNARTGSGYFSPYANPRLGDGPPGEYLTERLAQEAAAFIEQNRERRFFLNLWLYNVHTPLQARPEKIHRYEQLVDPGAQHHNPVYAAMVEHVDDAVGEVLDALDRCHLADNTVVVLTSDNGGLVGNHQKKRVRVKPTSNAPLRSGKGDSYEGGTRVPLIVRHPGRIQPGSVSRELVISQDLHPTLLECAGEPMPSEIAGSLDGLSIAAVLYGKAGAAGHDALFWHYPHSHTEGATPYSAVRRGAWKLIEFLETGTVELYDLESDIAERNDLSHSSPELCRQLLAELHAWRISVNAQMPPLNPGFDPALSAEFELGAPL